MEETPDRDKPAALAMLSASRPRNLGWLGAAGLLFGDWGTSRLYVLGLAFLVAGRSSLVLIGFMSLLVLAVAWAYTHICRIYPDGGGVYTAGRQKARVLGVLGALLLLADYTVTASLSAVEGFHYFGLGKHESAEVRVEIAAPGPLQDTAPTPTTAIAATTPTIQTTRPVAVVTETEPEKVHDDAAKYGVNNDRIVLLHDDDKKDHEAFWKLNSPGLWALIAILIIGGANLLGPKHTAGYAIFTALGMIGITLLVTAAALPHVIRNWSALDFGTINHPPATLWRSFVYVVLALSGVEAIANLTGVMKKPVFETARKSIWPVAIEVAAFNMLLAITMVALATVPTVTGQPLTRDAHTEDMLAYMAKAFLGPWGEWPVRVVGGLLLLSAANTAVGAIASILYVMSRDGELPEVFQKLNRFGSPWVATIVAATVPASVLLFAHDLTTLASLYAIGVVGAVAINCILCAFHNRLPKTWRHIAMFALGLLLVALWITLAATKIHALIFVTTVMVVGMGLRQLNLVYKQRMGDKPSLLRQAIIEQLTPDALAAPKMLIGTYGSTDLAMPALREAKREGSTLVVAFIREIQLSHRVDLAKFSLDTDPVAVRTFAKFLDLAHAEGCRVLPVYDTGPDAATLLAENAAMHGCSKVLLGSSRHGAIYRLIKGKFQQRLESLLPAEIPVQVVSPEPLKAEGH